MLASWMGNSVNWNMSIIRSDFKDTTGKPDMSDKSAVLPLLPRTLQAGSVMLSPRDFWVYVTGEIASREHAIILSGKPVQFMGPTGSRSGRDVTPEVFEELRESILNLLSSPFIGKSQSIRLTTQHRHWVVTLTQHPLELEISVWKDTTPKFEEMAA